MIETNRHILRLAGKNDRSGIIEFIRTEWNPNHIFVHDADFFTFEFCREDRINFILAINKQTSQIDGLVGFLPYSQNLENADVFGAIWKARNNTGDPMLGIRLLTYVKDQLPIRTFSGVGANPKTLPIYNYIGYPTEKLRQYYLLNDTLDTYKVAEIRNRPSFLKKNANDNKRLLLFSNIESLKKLVNPERFANQIPYKDEWYLNRRYFNHPIYTYQVWAIRGQGSDVNSFFIAREISANGGKVLRIVDFIGEDRDLGGIGPSLYSLMVEHGYEYIDFYQYGIDETILRDAGFTRRQDNDENIIPNYFEPFVRKNIEIPFFTTCKGKFHLFKADGDQDRPSFPVKRNQPE